MAARRRLSPAMTAARSIWWRSLTTTAAASRETCNDARRLGGEVADRRRRGLALRQSVPGRADGRALDLWSRLRPRWARWPAPRDRSANRRRARRSAPDGQAEVRRGQAE